MPCTAASVCASLHGPCTGELKPSASVMPSLSPGGTVCSQCLATHIHLNKPLLCAAVPRVEQDAAAAAERKRKKLQQRLA